MSIVLLRVERSSVLNAVHPPTRTRFCPVADLESQKLFSFRLIYFICLNGLKETK